MTTETNSTETFDTIVIGGGQAGLAMGHALAERGCSFVILDAHPRVGDAWRTRWDSLVLFTPARYCALPGMRFPASGGDNVTKDAMADYLESYAERFHLPVRTNTRVDGLTRRGDRFVVTAGDRTFEADNVVVAMANFQQPKVPPFAADLDPSIVQMHSYEYRNPSQLADGPVLLVGVGNSGAEIAMELAMQRPTTIAGKEAGHIPLPIDSRIGRHIGVRVVRLLGHHILTVDTRLGRKVRTHFLIEATPLIRAKPKDLAAAGVGRVGRITGVNDGRPVTDDGQVLDVANVIWCTGWRPGFSWIDLPVLGDRQEPVHERGVVTQEPGLYFIGLEFIYAATSATVTGVGRDAERVANHIAERKPALARVAQDAAAA
jgi:putative flavoprotein involved in K+ transport